MNLSNRSFEKRHRSLGRTLSACLMVGLMLLLGMALLPSAVQAGEGGPTVEWRFSFPRSGENSGMPAPVPMPLPQDATVFTGDLKVSGGESYDGDVVVYNGDVDIEGGGRIAGSLYVYSGNIDLKGGGQVRGDVIAYGGDVDIESGGQVGGNVQALGGDVTLKDGASVGGDVSVFGGNIDRAAGAQVGGNVLSGPNITIPAFPVFPGAPEITIPGIQPAPPERPDLTNGSAGGVGFGNWLLRFVLNLFRAALLTLLAVVGTGLVIVSRPALVDKSLAFVDDDPRTSFGVGLLANMVVMIPLWMWLGSLSVGFLVALCLSPLLLPLGLIALVIELTGLAVVGRWLGDRIAHAAHFEWEPLAATAVGVTLIAGLTGFLWALTSCLGWLLLIVLGAPGVGALVIQWRERRSGGSPGPDAPVRSQEIVPPTEPAEGPDVTAETVSLDLDGPPVATDSHETNDLSDVQAGEFDFTQLAGIGPVFSMRLKAANVRTLGDLAAMTPESVADVLNVSVERVVRDDLLGQARRLLGLE